MTVLDADAVVVGGGLTGIAAAVTAAKAGLRTIHLAPHGPADRRTSALMMPSVSFLGDAGLIETPESVGHALTQIRIIDATPRLLRAPEILFDANEAGLAAFGWNFANVRLTDSFQAAGATFSNLTTLNLSIVGIKTDAGGSVLSLSGGETLRAPLVIGADGKGSLVRKLSGFHARERAFGQSALVCDLRLSRPIGGTSIEFHYPNGPFTLVPAGDDRANLVWIDELAVLKQAQQMDTPAFQAVLQEKSQRLFGTIEALTPAHVFPLSTLSVDRAGRDGVVLVGEAAHAFPPIGAQGLNLGLRDVADLALVLAQTDRNKPDWANSASLEYATRRSADLARTGTMVDTLFRSLLAEMLPSQAMRAGGIWALKLLPGLRKTAFGLGMGVRQA